MSTGVLTSIKTIGGVTVLAIAAFGCDTRPPIDEAHKPVPASRFDYRLEVDPDSLPTGVAARERRVPGTGQVQMWIENETETPFVIISVDRQGAVTRRQKIVGGRVYLELTPGQRLAGENWQHLEGVDKVLLDLNYTPDVIVRGRSKQTSAVVGVPLPEPFSITAMFGNEMRPIRGQIIYFSASAGSQ